ncbi:MAG: hypothetical protein NWP98_05880 [Erythrobacter sp.]|nr:hypothetical protein [Erythrobacter sp.]
MDETTAIPYLCGTMTRHILALLALLTGLAAFGSPAQASLTEALACNSSIAAAAGEETSGIESAPVQTAPTTLSQSREVEAPESCPATPRALRLPVLMGIERAYE